MFNLLHEPWLPVRMVGGELCRIAPYQIGDPDIAELAPGRADFKAALMEFLVGLMQTAFAPPSPRDWKTRLDTPPSEAELRQAFQPHESFFELLGERKAGKGLFMQDLTMCDADKPARSDVDSLLIEQANADLFVHPGGIQSLCPACAAAALYTLQTFAPSGGRGHRTSLRGGGPLSTLLKGQNLWESVWLNVLPSGSRPDEMPSAPDTAQLAGQVYAWAAATRTSEKGEETHPEDMHPLHAYWGMPRRLLLEAAPAEKACDICGGQHETAITGVLARPSGYNYSAYWQHPLTPYRLSEGSEPLSIKGQSNAAAYSNWLGVVYGEPRETGRAANFVEPARCCRRREARNAAHKQINAAGYNMSNMKAVSWCEHVFPILDVPEDEAFRKLFAQTVDDMVQAAGKTQRTLANCLKDALVNRAGKKQASIDKAIFADAVDTFWNCTEADFYRLIARLTGLPPGGEAWQEARYAWGKCLLTAVNRIYETVAWVGFSPERMEQRVTAQGLLNGATIQDLRNRVMYPPKQKEKKS